MLEGMMICTSDALSLICTLRTSMHLRSALRGIPKKLNNGLQYACERRQGLGGQWRFYATKVF